MGKPDKQALLNAFYDCANFVQISLTMDPAVWAAVKAEIPAGGTEGSGEHHVGPRYQWHTVNVVTILIYKNGSRSPTATLNYTNVAIKKKSWWGSFSTTKPSLRLDFTKYNEANGNIEGQIGTTQLVLNNSKQDPCFLRQPVGYALMRMCGTPAFRCNLANVVVNGASSELYVNVEAFAKEFVKNDANNFQAGDNGNGYEISTGDDLYVTDISKPGWLDFEGFSQYEDKKDLLVAANALASGGITAMPQVVDMDAFLLFMAMEWLMRQGDGYCGNRNNTYMYNDKKAVATPTTADVNLKFIMSGIDQTCVGNNYEQYSAASLPSLVMGDPSSKTKLAAVFARLKPILVSPSDKLRNVWSPLKDYMTAYNFMTSDISSRIDSYLSYLPTDTACQNYVNQLS